jgi:hypothetical protein
MGKLARGEDAAGYREEPAAVMHVKASMIFVV